MLEMSELYLLKFKKLATETIFLKKLEYYDECLLQKGRERSESDTRIRLTDRRKHK